MGWEAVVGRGGRGWACVGNGYESDNITGCVDVESGVRDHSECARDSGDTREDGIGCRNSLGWSPSAF